MEEKEKEIKRLLFIVDPQHDFIDGSLAVPNADKAMNALAEYIIANKDNYDAVAVSLDWHPKNHCSFIGTTLTEADTKVKPSWPPHCQMFSKGAAAWQPILDALSDIDTYMLTKGSELIKDAYSLFQDMDSNLSFRNIMDDFSINEVHFCGIVREVCVMNTMKDFIRIFPNVKTKVLMQFTPEFNEEGAKQFDEFLAENPDIEKI